MADDALIVEVLLMRISRTAIMMMLLVAGASAQSGGRQVVRPLPGQTPPYSPAVAVGGAIYVSGQLPTDDTGALAPGDITAQAKQVFDNLRSILRQSGSSLDNAVHATVMLQSAADVPALDAFYRQQFTGEPPARTMIIGNMVRAGALLEIQMTAVSNGAERRAILPPGWVKPAGPYSYAIKSGDTLYLSGLVSTNGKGNTPVPGDAAAQTTAVMGNAGEILKAAGMSYGDLVLARVAMRDMAQFQSMNDVYRTYWEKDRPARVSSQAAPPGASDVEITFVAIKGSAPREAIVPARADGAPGQAGPNFSPAIKVGNRLFVSGGTGDTEANAGDMQAQTAETLARIGPILKAGGFDYRDVVSTEVLVTDVQKFNAMNDGYRPVFPLDPPARATVGVGRLASPTALVEITVLAAK